MPTELPQVRVITEGGGCMVTCDCGYESWWPGRPAADRTARTHQTACMKKKRGA